MSDFTGQVPWRPGMPKQKVTTMRETTVAVMAVVTLPAGVEVHGGIKTTDAGRIAEIFAEEVVRDALSEAGFVLGADRCIATLLAHKGATPAGYRGDAKPHNDRQKEAIKEAERYAERVRVFKLLNLPECGVASCQRRGSHEHTDEEIRNALNAERRPKALPSG